MKLQVCILVPGEPSIRMQDYILRYKRVQYLKGDAINNRDLERAKCTIADAAFILTDRFTNDTDAQDAITVRKADGN